MILTKKIEVDPLDALANEAMKDLAGADVANADQVGDGVAVVKDLTNAQCLMMAFEIMRETLCSFAKVTSPKQTMANDVMLPVADSVGALLDKYGVSLSGVAGDFMTEIKAAIATVPVLLSIRAGLQAEMKATKKDVDVPVAVASAQE